VQKSVEVTEIMNFFKGIVFYWRTLYVIEMNHNAHRYIQ